MAPEDTPPTTKQNEDIVREVKTKVEDEGKDMFHPKDIDKLVSSEEYVARFWIHAFFIPGDRLENTVNLVVNTFKWRKQFGVHEISENVLDKKIMEKGALYSRNRDRDGCKILVFCIRKHVKDPEKMQRMKEFFVYMLDRLEREENGRKITIIFDSESAGLANFDIEIVRFVIQVLIGYYPNFVNKILVYEMPWILNTAWKIIKSLLPAPAVARIKFVSKSSIEQLVSPDNLLSEWGGLDTWQYRWVAEDDGVGRDVEGDCVKISPEKIVMFSSTDHNNLEAEVLIQNVSSLCLAFKMKSTCPSIFLVRPHTAMVAPMQEMMVRIRTPSTTRHSKIHEHKFQINYLTMEHQLEPDKLPSLFSTSSTTSSTILSCGVDTSVSHSSTQDTPGMVTNIQNRTRMLSDRVVFLEEKLHYLQQMLLCQGILVIVFLACKWGWSRYGYGVFREEAEL